MVVEFDDANEFDLWLQSMQDRRDSLRARFPADQRPRLDLSTSSLDVVEAWIEAKTESYEELMSRDWELLEELTGYVGEVLRRTVGGD